MKHRLLFAGAACDFRRYSNTSKLQSQPVSQNNKKNKNKDKNQNNNNPETSNNLKRLINTLLNNNFTEKQDPMSCF